MEISFKTNTKPVSLNSAYPSNKSGRRFLSQEGAIYKNTLGWEAKQVYKGEPLTTPLTAILRFGFKDQRKRDVDNFVKIALDSLTGILYKDDSQICQFTASKEYAIMDFVEITIKEIEDK